MLGVSATLKCCRSWISASVQPVLKGPYATQERFLIGYRRVVLRDVNHLRVFNQPARLFFDMAGDSCVDATFSHNVI